MISGWFLSLIFVATLVWIIWKARKDIKERNLEAD